MQKASIVIPIYNEARTLKKIVQKVRTVELQDIAREIILVDDGSTDGSREILASFNGDPIIKTILLETNIGKSGAVQAGFKACTGDMVIIQDADLEYSPSDYPALIKPILNQTADVVFGSRFKDSQLEKKYFWHTLLNKSFTYTTNLLSGLTLTDAQTCYKVFSKKVLEEVGLHMNSKGFGFDPEFTMRIAQKKYRVTEVPVSYNPRSHAEGKHMDLNSALFATWCLFKYRFISKD